MTYECCINCTERRPATRENPRPCHCDCEQYLTLKAENDAIKEKNKMKSMVNGKLKLGSAPNHMRNKT